MSERVIELEHNRELLDGFRRGQPDALTQLYDAYVLDVARLVQCVLHDPGSEADLVQEIFIKAFSERARQGYDGLRPYRPYLMQIARNALTDHLRRLGRQLPLAEFEVDDDDDATALATEAEVDSFAGAEEELHWHRLRQATQAYVETLPGELQEFVRLRYIEELSQRDLVARLRLSRWKVRGYERRVQQGLREHLKRVSMD